MSNSTNNYVGVTSKNGVWAVGGWVGLVGAVGRRGEGRAIVYMRILAIPFILFTIILLYPAGPNDPGC